MSVGSSIKGLGAAITGAAATIPKLKQGNEASQINSLGENAGMNLYNSVFSSFNETRQNNMLKRGDEAMELTRQVQEAVSFQRDAFRVRVMALKGGLNSEEGQKQLGEFNKKVETIQSNYKKRFEQLGKIKYHTKKGGKK